ncbi:hypothetical protein GDO78_020500 [Eleutherodactylus coqui]|uniref:Uncharacterized protein n=1 Tax=Eleutherodactylus coqui TaxID=57060 RepID=A0A8J6E8H6_ELECQ|nr:hypothetical protein GDO78_020500 [Eleutherodactylus coqui]
MPCALSKRSTAAAENHPQVVCYQPNTLSICAEASVINVSSCTTCQTGITNITGSAHSGKLPKSNYCSPGILCTFWLHPEDRPARDTATVRS